MGKAPAWPDDGILLYDGACILCSGWVRFVARQDTARRLRFTPIDSPYGRQMAAALNIDPQDPDTNAVILDGHVLMRSDAALAVLSVLPGWRWTGWLHIVPRSLRDGIYTLVARNRYRLLGQRTVCGMDGAAFADRVVVKALSGS